LAERDKKLADTLVMAFEQTDNIMNENFREIKGTQPSFIELSGCTGSVLLVQEDYFVIANAGDSPIVIFRDEETMQREGEPEATPGKQYGRFKAE